MTDEFKNAKLDKLATLPDSPKLIDGFNHGADWAYKWFDEEVDKVNDFELYLNSRLLFGLIREEEYLNAALIAWLDYDRR